MAKRNIIRKSTKPFIYNPNYYSWGGDFKKGLKENNPFDLSGALSGSNVANMLKGGAGVLGNTVGNIAGNAISGGLKSGAGNAINKTTGTLGSVVGAVNPILGGIVSAGGGIIGGLVNKMFGSDLNEEKIAEVEGSNKAINTTMVDNSSADSIENQWAKQDFGAAFTKSDIGKDGWFSNTAKNKYKELLKQQDIARNRALTSYENAATAADFQSDLNAMANYAAFGGPLDTWNKYGNGAIGYELAKEDLGIKALNAVNKGKLTSLPNSFESSELNTFADGGSIHIDPSKRGTFTAAAKKHGKSVQEFASQVLANKENYSPTMIKKANFARNSTKWHSFGGDLNTNGADFSNGQTIIGNGDTHENNKYEGVPIGVDAEGVPNLVEQGEVIFNDYVFSNRLFADKGLLENFNLPKSYNGYSFAAIAEKLGEESKERPNDPISKRGLMNSMSKLQQAQEIMRQRKQKGHDGQEGVQYDEGGLMEIDNKLDEINNSIPATLIKTIDPIGITSYYDVYSAGKEAYNNPSWSNLGALGLETLGAIPLIGKFGKIIKGGKAIERAIKAGKSEKQIRKLKRAAPMGEFLGFKSPSAIKDSYNTVQYQKNKKARGGKMGTLFAGPGDMPNFLDGKDYGDWQDYGTLLKPIKAEEVWNETMANTDKEDDDSGSKLTWLRYAPVVGSAIGIGQNLFSKPDYTSANAILEAANQAGNYTPIGYTPIGNYLQYKPFDRNYYMTKLNAQSGASRRAIMNTTSPSRNAALLAADYNAQGRLGDLARQAEEYNLAQRQAVEQFNRGTNQANAEMGLKAAMANQEAALKARSSRLSGVAQAMSVRDAVDARRGASLSANLTNFFNSLGDIGKEEFSRSMVLSNPALYYSIRNGKIYYKNGYDNLSEAEKKEVRDAAAKEVKKRGAKNGYLTIRN